MNKNIKFEIVKNYIQFSKIRKETKGEKAFIQDRICMRKAHIYSVFLRIIRKGENVKSEGKGRKAYSTGTE